MRLEVKRIANLIRLLKIGLMLLFNFDLGSFNGGNSPVNQTLHLSNTHYPVSLALQKAFGCVYPFL
jgi:hypothetical protein